MSSNFQLEQSSQMEEGSCQDLCLPLQQSWKKTKDYVVGTQVWAEEQRASDEGQRAMLECI